MNIKQFLVYFMLPLSIISNSGFSHQHNEIQKISDFKYNKNITLLINNDVNKYNDFSNKHNEIQEPSDLTNEDNTSIIQLINNHVNKYDNDFSNKHNEIQEPSDLTNEDNTSIIQLINNYVNKYNNDFPNKYDEIQENGDFTNKDDTNIIQLINNNYVNKCNNKILKLNNGNSQCNAAALTQCLSTLNEGNNKCLKIFKNIYNGLILLQNDCSNCKVLQPMIIFNILLYRLIGNIKFKAKNDTKFKEEYEKNLSDLKEQYDKFYNEKSQGAAERYNRLVDILNNISLMLKESSYNLKETNASCVLDHANKQQSLSGTIESSLNEFDIEITNNTKNLIVENNSMANIEEYYNELCQGEVIIKGKVFDLSAATLVIVNKDGTPFGGSHYLSAKKLANNKWILIDSTINTKTGMPKEKEYDSLADLMKNKVYDKNDPNKEIKKRLLPNLMFFTHKYNINEVLENNLKINVTNKDFENGDPVVYFNPKQNINDNIQVDFYNSDVDYKATLSVNNERFSLAGKTYNDQRKKAEKCKSDNYAIMKYNDKYYLAYYENNEDNKIDWYLVDSDYDLYQVGDTSSEYFSNVNDENNIQSSACKEENCNNIQNSNNYNIEKSLEDDFKIDIITNKDFENGNPVVYFNPKQNIKGNIQVDFYNSDVDYKATLSVNNERFSLAGKTYNDQRKKAEKYKSDNYAIMKYNDKYYLAYYENSEDNMSSDWYLVDSDYDLYPVGNTRSEYLSHTNNTETIDKRAMNSASNKSKYANAETLKDIKMKIKKGTGTNTITLNSTILYKTKSFLIPLIKKWKKSGKNKHEYIEEFCNKYHIKNYFCENTEEAFNKLLSDIEKYYKLSKQM